MKKYRDDGLWREMMNRTKDVTKKLEEAERMKTIRAGGGK